MINAILDFDKPYRALEAGDDPDYLEQGGCVYAWSDSNVRYERAWWLDDGVKESALVRGGSARRGRYQAGPMAK